MSPFPAIAALVPHAPPMILIDALLAHGDKRATCAVMIRPDMPFVEHGRVATIVCLEYMAQSVAVYAGYDARATDDPVAVAFLIGCRSLVCHQPYIAVGTALRVEVHHVWGDQVLGSFDCAVSLTDGAVIATARLSVAQPKSGSTADTAARPEGAHG